ncbi:precorrin-6A/cobalt-precorrin-6A reductase [Streptomyces sioyaensis]|uniref:precorrin-6A/cobalt-precorrin-6A reductase n=1 Tax=Streptomyces sioyaensis TaxID=67364 RepID=UPI0037B55B41
MTAASHSGLRSAPDSDRRRARPARRCSECRGSVMLARSVLQQVGDSGGDGQSGHVFEPRPLAIGVALQEPPCTVRSHGEVEGTEVQPESGEKPHQRPAYLVRAGDRLIGEVLVPFPPRIEVLLDRGPFTVAGERALLREHHIDVVVTKDSGVTATAAKRTGGLGGGSVDGGGSGFGRALGPHSARPIRAEVIGLADPFG